MICPCFLCSKTSRVYDAVIHSYLISRFDHPSNNSAPLQPSMIFLHTLFDDVNEFDDRLLHSFGGRDGQMLQHAAILQTIYNIEWATLNNDQAKKFVDNLFNRCECPGLEIRQNRAASNVGCLKSFTANCLQYVFLLFVRTATAVEWPKVRVWALKPIFFKTWRYLSGSMILGIGT